jgi:hypothetical protein
MTGANARRQRVGIGGDHLPQQFDQRRFVDIV